MAAILQIKEACLGIMGDLVSLLKHSNMSIP